MTPANPDAQAICDLISNWLRLTAAGDVDGILELMAEDIVFLLPGQPPMKGREAFAAGLRAALPHVNIQGTADIQEIQVFGKVAMTPRSGDQPAKRHSGNILSIFRKQPAGNWVLWRDANLLTEGQ